MIFRDVQYTGPGHTKIKNQIWKYTRHDIHNKKWFNEEKFKNDEAQKTEIRTELSHFYRHFAKGHFTKVYSIKVCELQNFPEIL